ncbi:hypothetical protein [Sorangium sp. So ce363]|uniref:hypothetical protein n=1 Tax=Sorangium sp. So ce363 TaxID=3133304 RepID=UPI003F5F8075
MVIDTKKKPSRALKLAEATNAAMPAARAASSAAAAAPSSCSRLARARIDG